MAVALRGSASVPAGNPTTSFTVTIDAAVQTNDVLFLLVTSRDQAGIGTLAVTDDDSGGNTWTRIGTWTIGDAKLTQWWKRATSGTASKTVTVSNTTGSAAGVLKAFSGAITTGNPYADQLPESHASGTETASSITPTHPDSMVCCAIVNYQNDNAVTSFSSATLGALTTTEKLSTGGSDCATAFGHVLQVGAAAATGAFTWAQVDGATYTIAWTIFPAVQRDPAQAPLTLAGTVGALALGIGVSVGALALTGPAPTCTVVTSLPFSDTFGDASLDAGKWGLLSATGDAGTDPLVTVVETTVLTITPRALVAGDHYNGVAAVPVFDFTGAAVVIEAPTVPNIAVSGPFTSFLLSFSATDAAKHAEIAALETNGLYFRYNGGEVATGYNATTQRWWRIRHVIADDTLRWEVSPDGVTWTQHRSEARTDSITQTRVNLAAGTYASVVTPGVAVFDNFSAATSAIDTTIAVPAGTLVLGGPYAVRPPDLRLTGYAPTVTAGANISLAIPAGTLTLAGQTPALSLSLTQSPAAGSLALAGPAPVSSLGTVPSPTPGVLLLQGQTPLRVIGTVAQPTPGVIVLTGQQPAANSGIAVSSGALVLAGFPPTLAGAGAIIVDTGGLALAGPAPTLQRTYLIAPTQGALNVLGFAPSLSVGVFRNPAAGDMVLAGQAPSRSSNHILSPAVGALTLTGRLPVATIDVPRAPAAGSLILAGQTPSLSLTVSVPAGALTLTGQTPSLSAGVGTNPAQGDLVLAGPEPVSSLGTVPSPAPGALGLSGPVPLRVVGAVMQPAQGALVLAGQTPGANTGIGVPVGALMLAGYAPSLPVTGAIVVGTGTLNLSGQTPTLVRTYLSAPAQGALNLLGQAPSLIVGVFRNPAVGSLVLTGQTPTRVSNHLQTPAAGTLILQGQPPLSVVSILRSPATGTLLLQGQAPTARANIFLTVPTGTLMLTGWGLTVSVSTGFVPRLALLGVG